MPAGEHSLDLPNSLKDLPEDPDDDFIVQLEHSIADWSATIASVLGAQQQIDLKDQSKCTSSRFMQIPLIFSIP